MTLTFYDFVTTQGFGKKIYPSLEGQVELILWQDIYADLEELLDSEPYGTMTLAMQISPFIRVTSDISAIQAIATPDRRYKLGTYAGIRGYTITVDSEENIITVPISQDFRYLHYPVQSLETYRMVLSHPDPNPFDYEVNFDSGGTLNTAITIADVRQFAVGFSQNNGINGLFINLAASVVADIVCYYAFKSVNITLEPGVDLFAPPW